MLTDIPDSIEPICGMVYKEIIAAYFKNDSKYLNTLRGKNAEILVLKLAIGVIITRE